MNFLSKKRVGGSYDDVCTRFIIILLLHVAAKILHIDNDQVLGSYTFK